MALELCWKGNLAHQEPKSIESRLIFFIYYADNIVSTTQVALESVSATHQLNSAIHTLALCVRPLLLTGFAANPESAESGPIDAGEHKVCLLDLCMPYRHMLVHTSNSHNL